MNLPNKLTILRIILVPFFIATILIDFPLHYLVSGIIFGIVAVSTGSLWPSIVLHFLNNLFSVLILCADSNFSETAANFFVFIMLGVLVLQGIAGGVIFFTMRYRPRFAKGVKTLNNGEKANALFGNPVMIAALVAMVLVALTSISF